MKFVIFRLLILISFSLYGIYSAEHLPMAQAQETPLTLTTPTMTWETEAEVSKLLLPSSQSIVDSNGVTVNSYRLGATHTLGGSNSGITISGNILYYTEGADVVIADITNPQSPQTLSRWRDAEPAQMFHLHVHNQLLYIPISSFDGIKILDVSDATHPRKVGTIPLLFINNTAYLPDSIGVKGTTAYITDGKYLRVVDVSVPSEPVNTAVITPTNTFVDNLTLSGNYAFVTSGSSATPRELVVIDITIPTSPTVVTRLPLGSNYPFGITISENVLLVTDEEGVRVFDITNPRSPLQRSLFTAPELQPRSRAAVNGNLVYVGHSPLHVIDISNLSTPTLTGVADYQTVGYELYNKGNTVYLGSRFSGLALLDVTNRAAPTFVKTVGELTYAQDVAPLDSERAYVASLDALWYVTAAGTAMTTRAVWQPTTNYVNAVAVNAQALYVIGADKESYLAELYIFNISNPGTPVYIKTIPLNDYYAGSVTIFGQRLYAASLFNITVFDISDPVDPQLLGVAATPRDKNIRSLAANGANVYAVLGDTLHIFDATQPATLPLVTQYSLNYGNAVALYQQNAFIAQSPPGLEIVDIANPANPQQRKILSENSAGFAVAATEHFAYLGSGSRSIDLFPLDDLANVSTYPKDELAIPDVAEDIKLAGDTIWVASGSGGILRVAQFEEAQAYIAQTGGVVATSNQAISLSVPANTFTNTVWMSMEEQPATTVPGFGNSERFFSLTAIYTDTYQFADLQAGKSLMVAISFEPDRVRAETLGLYWFDGVAWSQRGISSTVDSTASQVTAQLSAPVVNRLSREQAQTASLLNGETMFALLWKPRQLFLPAVQR